MKRGGKELCGLNGVLREGRAAAVGRHSGAGAGVWVWVGRGRVLVCDR